MGADRLPPLNANGTVESVTKWILEVQCLIATSSGLAGLTPASFGLPAGYGAQESEDLSPFSVMGGASARQPMQELTQGVSAAAAATFQSASNAAVMTRSLQPGVFSM